MIVLFSGELAAI